MVSVHQRHNRLSLSRSVFSVRTTYLQERWISLRKRFQLMNPNNPNSSTVRHSYYYGVRDIFPGNLTYHPKCYWKYKGGPCLSNVKVCRRLQEMDMERSLTRPSCRRPLCMGNGRTSSMAHVRSSQTDLFRCRLLDRLTQYWGATITEEGDSHSFW